MKTQLQDFGGIVEDLQVLQVALLSWHLNIKSSKGTEGHHKQQTQEFCIWIFHDFSVVQAWQIPQETWQSLLTVAVLGCSSKSRTDAGLGTCRRGLFWASTREVDDWILHPSLKIGWALLIGTWASMYPQVMSTVWWPSYITVIHGHIIIHNIWYMATLWQL